MKTRNNRITNFERSILHQNRGDRTTTFIESRFNNRAFSSLVRIGFQLKDFSLQQNHLEQCIEICFLFCRNLNENGIAAPLFRNQLIFGQFLLNPLGVSIGLINFIDCNNQRNTGRLRVADRLFRLRHHAVISSHHKNNNIGDTGTTGTHCGKRFVTGSIKESYFLIFKLNIVSTNMLSDATGLTLGHICFTNGIKQAGFTVIDVTHYRDNRWTGFKIFHLIISLFLRFDFENCLLIKCNVFNLMIKLRGKNCSRFIVERMIDRDHRALAH